MFGSAWCLVMVQIQFSLMKKIKIGRPKYLLTPFPPPCTTAKISFLPYLPNPPPPPPQSGRHIFLEFLEDLVMKFAVWSH